MTFSYYVVGIQLVGTIGEKGQVVIPKPLRDQFKLLPNSTVTFTLESNKITLEKKENPAQILEQFLNAAPKKPFPKTIHWDELYHSRMHS